MKEDIQIQTAKDGTIYLYHELGYTVVFRIENLSNGAVILQTLPTNTKIRL